MSARGPVAALYQAVTVLVVAMALGSALAAEPVSPPSTPVTKEDLARVSKTMKWEDAEEPVRILGPLYFVGTKGLGIFLFTTSEGHVLMNTGMPSSGPMIVESIRKLGFRPEHIKIMINSHAHMDHAGAFASMKKKLGAQLAIMKADVAAMESGDKDDFRYGSDLAYPPAKVDRVLRDGETIKMGEVLLTAYHTPGHTRGATTWVANLTVDGKAYVVAFPDGTTVNPGYRLVENPSYPGIADDYRRTFTRLEGLSPDIWLAPHNEPYDLEGKRRRALTEGVSAWIDPEGYRRFVAKKKQEFEDLVDLETGVKKPAIPTP
jgi:metallo-beta-lactamase class B